MRREELCDPHICPDSPEGGGRCDHCPLDKLDAAQSSARGIVIRCALDLMGLIKHRRECFASMRSPAMKLQAMLIIAEERDLLEREKLPGNGR